MDRRGLWAAVALLVSALVACGGGGEAERTSRAITLGRLGLKTLEAGEPNWHLVLNDNTTLLDQYACAPGVDCTLSAGQEIDARIGQLRPHYESGACLTADCDSAGEIARLCYDDLNDALKCCSGAGGWVDCGAGGGGSGDITSVGSCLTAACFQSEGSRFFLAAPYGGGQMTPRAIEDADLPASIARDSEITASTCLDKDLDATCEVGTDPPPGTGVVSIDPDDDGVAECTINGSSLLSCTAHPTSGGYLQLREGADDGTNSVTLQIPDSGLTATKTYTANAVGQFPSNMIVNWLGAGNLCAEYDADGVLQAASYACNKTGPTVRWFAPFGMGALEETSPGTDEECTCWLWNIPYHMVAQQLVYNVTTADTTSFGQFGLYSISGTTATRQSTLTYDVATTGLKQDPQTITLSPGEFLLCQGLNDDDTALARLRAAGEGAAQFCGHFTTACSAGLPPSSISIPSPLPQDTSCKPPVFWLSSEVPPP